MRIRTTPTTHPSGEQVRRLGAICVTFAKGRRTGDADGIFWWIEAPHRRLTESTFLQCGGGSGSEFRGLIRGLAEMLVRFFFISLVRGVGSLSVSVQGCRKIGRFGFRTMIARKDKKEIKKKIRKY